MYMTSALSKNDMKAIGLQMALDLLAKKEKRDSITGLRTRTQPGRPDWGKVTPCSTHSHGCQTSLCYSLLCVCVCASCFRKCPRSKKGKSTCFTAALLLSPKSSRHSASTSNSTSTKRTSERTPRCVRARARACPGVINAYYSPCHTLMSSMSDSEVQEPFTASANNKRLTLKRWQSQLITVSTCKHLKTRKTFNIIDQKSCHPLIVLFCI